MAKNLVKRALEGAKKGLLVVSTVASIGLSSMLASCKQEQDYAPETELSATPTSGYAPLETKIQYNGEDLNGDIKEYQISIDEGKDGIIDETISQSAPIDVTRTFNKDTKITAKCTDYAGLSDEKTIDIDIEEPYENHAPEFNLSNPLVEVNEGQQCFYDTGGATDGDGDALTYSKVEAPEWFSQINSEGIMSGPAPQVEADTEYNVKVKASDGTADTIQNGVVRVKNVPSEPPVDNDYLDISGRLEDCENDGTGRAGIVRVYNASDNSQIGGDYPVNGSGDFSITLDKLVSELSNGIKIQAMMGTPSAPESYVRTKAFPKGDVTNALMRVVPYDNPNDTYDDGLISGQITPTQFANFLEDINSGIVGLQKFDLDSLTGIEILRYNHQEGHGEFSQEKQEGLRDKILDKYDLGGMFEGEPSDGKLLLKNGRLITIQVDNGINPSNRHYNYTDTNIEPNEKGWIIIEPEHDPEPDIPNELGSTKRFNFGGKIGYTDAMMVKLQGNETNPDFPLDYVDSHEIGGHSSGVAPYEANNTLTYPSTVMEPEIKSYDEGVIMGNADLKAAKIVNENTYLAKESLSNIMKLDWEFE